MCVCVFIYKVQWETPSHTAHFQYFSYLFKNVSCWRSEPDHFSWPNFTSNSIQNFQAFERHNFFFIVTVFGNVGYFSKQFVHDQGDGILSGTECSSLEISGLGEVRSSKLPPTQRWHVPGRGWWRVWWWKVQESDIYLKNLLQAMEIKECRMLGNFFSLQKKLMFSTY